MSTQNKTLRPQLSLVRIEHCACVEPRPSWSTRRGNLTFLFLLGVGIIC